MTLRSGSAERHENMDSGSGTVTVDDTAFQGAHSGPGPSAGFWPADLRTGTVTAPGTTPGGAAAGARRQGALLRESHLVRDAAVLAPRSGRPRRDRGRWPRPARSASGRGRPVRRRGRPAVVAAAARSIRAGSFGLIQQFGVGVDTIDLDAAAREGVWVAGMPGLNAVPVAEHAVALLLALARRLPEASKGFEPGRWGEPAGRSLAGTAACIVGAGAIGTQIARRLAQRGMTQPPSVSMC
jgi:D-isomer specific 2-hydroxyacid dehydrogenase, catalytic domain/D-isomer specific 2-hydroxyacid dehydrogenase, NAD binding domain